MKRWTVDWHRDGSGGYYKTINGSLYRIEKRAMWRCFCELALVGEDYYDVMTAKIAAHKHARQHAELFYVTAAQELRVGFDALEGE